MIQGLDTVVLTRDVVEHGLRKGDVGAVVYSGDNSFEVEFVSADGRTIAVLSLASADVRCTTLFSPLQ